MKESISSKPDEIFSSGYDSSEEPEENNFNSPEANPENIFLNQTKENSEQLSSKILGFTFKLESYELVNLESVNELITGGVELSVIYGNLEKIKINELILKLVFVSKNKKSEPNLKEHLNEIKSLINSDIDFIAFYRNQLYIKYINECTTNEAYVSLQKSFDLFDLLYDEDNLLNISEDNSEKKNNKKVEDKKVEEKKVENKINNETKNILFDKMNNITENNNLNMNVKKNLFTQTNPQINKKLMEQQPKPNIINPFFFPPQLYNPFLFQNNNFLKIPQINPMLPPQIPRMNPLLVQTATALALQNLMKLQQQQTQNKININLWNNNNDKNDLLNNFNIKNVNQINNNNIIKKININNNMNKNNSMSPINNKEPSTNSNSSSSSSKESSPVMNYQSKNIKNFKIEEKNNNNTIDNKINNNMQKNIDYNLEEIVQNNQYKEYFPKNIKEKEKEKEVKFQTNSTRDYKFKYVSRYIVQIENEKNFPVTKMIIGNNGMYLRNILYNNCIKFGDQSTKIRLRGRGSGYKEGPNKEESKDPMELCISSLNPISFQRCSTEIENLLQQIYYKYYNYQCKNILDKKKETSNNNDTNSNNNNTNSNNCPVVMKEILKYHYVVNRYNTLVKEEKKRKKEEELNKTNKNNEKKSDNDN